MHGEQKGVLCCLVAAVLLAVPCLASAAVINDGTTTAGMSLVSNIPLLTPVETFPSTSDLTVVGDGTVRMVNGNHYKGDLTQYGTYCVRAAWVSNVVPASTSLTMSADVISDVLNDNDRPGVVILNTATNKGLIVYAKPVSNLFRIATLDFNTQAATDTVLVASPTMTGFVGTTISNYEITVAPNGSDTDVTAKITQGANVYTLAGTFALGGNMATNAADIRVGYFGYFSSLNEDGYPIGKFDNLSLAPVPEPTSLGLAIVGTCVMLARRRSIA
jgi:hypothetical protein